MTTTSPSSHLSPAARTGMATMAALALAGASLAGASSAAAAPGDSGAVRIHNPGMSASDTRDETTVCRFNLAAANFGPDLATVPWSIKPAPPNPNLPSLISSLPVLNGTGTTTNLTLPNGQYQLTWTAPGAVSKSFRVDCPRGHSGSPAKPAVSHGTPSGAVHAGGGGVPDLQSTAADTGSPIGPLLVTGALGAAGLIVVRRARRRVHGAA
ncbi:hypothetical protein [Streptomyces sp. NBC_01180]|uniref:hypothetical protein n=1 Tax=Streptomyces sp. NBC_01180 TaxID=2903763 RepID=UPI00386D80FD|nr:hypothetical protein OG708_29410 [Streptomyces sp. NBC_01180]